MDVLPTGATPASQVGEVTNQVLLKPGPYLVGEGLLVRGSGDVHAGERYRPTERSLRLSRRLRYGSRSRASAEQIPSRRSAVRR